MGASYPKRPLSCQRMSEPRMSTAICHLLLAGSSAWTCRTLHNAGQIQWAYGTLGLYFAKSIVGVLRYGSHRGYKIASWYNIIEAWSIAMGLPFLASDLYLLLHYNHNLSFIHAVLGLVMSCGVIFGSLVFNIGGYSLILKCLSIILIGSHLSVIAVGFVNRNYWAVAGTFSYYVNLFSIKQHGTIGRAPSIDLYTIGLCFFNYFMYKTLTDISVL